ncbi:bifunctional protein FolD [Cymbomonas tetramitiformis]|uniref:Bifunctional protein FolD n=1 Tax=Cymbomonas tetramitiformis TaxID=36881 RepID=A0AAE0LKT0_9CHLO|nr:bifunctional protein FolD [Cymbomonas tetramitiformis]
MSTLHKYGVKACVQPCQTLVRHSGAHRERKQHKNRRFSCNATGANSDEGAAIIDGKAIAQTVREEIGVEVASLKASTGKVPGLAVVLVGGRKDSETYVRSKKKGCEEAGIQSFGTDLPEDVTEEELLKVVADYNADPSVHGILVQLPLPDHINEENVLNAISIEKDVDGFHPLNMGLLAQRGREPFFVPCTPKGCVELLERSGIEISGKTAVVIGRSNIVGMPANLLLQRRDATVTVVHSRTPNAKEVTQQADIVIVACGRAEMVRGDWIKPGAAVIDVGINAVDDATKKRGYRLVGDACFDEIKPIAGAITPVPGGVGPMTIAMLLQNTLEGFKRTVSA